MDKKRKHIDDFFRDKLGGYSEVPPSDAWLDMDKKLDTLVPHTPTSPYRWLGHVGIVSLIAVLGVSVINKFSHQGEEAGSVSYNNQVINNIENTTDSKTVIEPVAKSPDALAAVEVVGNEKETPSIAPRQLQYEDALAFGESYSENADKEYVEGVTEIKKEDYSDPTTNTRLSSGAIVGSSLPASLVNNEINGLYKSLQHVENQLSSNGIDKKPEGLNAAGYKVTKPMANSNNSTKLADKTRLKPDFTRWELGVKAGYERGFDHIAAKGVAVSPYAGYNISKKISIVAQPTIKLAEAAARNIGRPASYYKVNNDGTVTAVENYVTSAVEGTTVTYYNNTRFRYTQTHDSIVKTNQTGGRYVQFELPVLVSYKIGNKVAVYGGVNTVYSQLQSVVEHTYTKAGIQQTAEVLVRSKESPSAPAIDKVITHEGTSYSEYNGPVYPENHESNLRVGAMVGVNYEYNKRWLVDAMVQKTPAPANVKSGYNINAPLSAPSFRLSVGYKIKK